MPKSGDRQLTSPDQGAEYSTMPLRNESPVPGFRPGAGPLSEQQSGFTEILRTAPKQLTCSGRTGEAGCRINGPGTWGHAAGLGPGGQQTRFGGLRGRPEHRFRRPRRSTFSGNLLLSHFVEFADSTARGKYSPKLDGLPITSARDGRASPCVRFGQREHLTPVFSGYPGSRLSMESDIPWES